MFNNFVDALGFEKLQSISDFLAKLPFFLKQYIALTKTTFTAFLYFYAE